MKTLEMLNETEKQRVNKTIAQCWIPVSRELPMRNVPLFLYEGSVSKNFSTGYYEEQWLDNEIHGDGVFYCTNRYVVHRPTHWMYAVTPLIYNGNDK